MLEILLLVVAGFVGVLIYGTVFVVVSRLTDDVLRQRCIRAHGVSAKGYCGDYYNHMPGYHGETFALLWPITLAFTGLWLLTSRSAVFLAKGPMKWGTAIADRVQHLSPQKKQIQDRDQRIAELEAKHLYTDVIS